MREQNFRVWDEDLKKMFYTAFSITSYGDVIDAGWKEEVGWTKYDYYSHEMQGGVDCVRMNGTGLKDKNGKEIYEGDWVRCFLKKTRYLEQNPVDLEMCFSDAWGAFGFTDGGAFWYWKDVREAEVIGNIYENPDMVV